MKKIFKDILRKIWYSSYKMTLAILYPINIVLVYLRRNHVFENSVMHISYMVHVPYHTTRILRQIGLKADYLAIGAGTVWNKSDFISPNSKLPFIQALKEFVLFWRVISKYEVIHLHFAHVMSRTGWELSVFKKLGRKIVIHYRGCEIRDYNINLRLHPEMNICQECDYNHYCISKENISRIKRVSQYGDAFLVTTPDLKDFVPDAVHMPFFCPEDEDIPENVNNDRLRYPDAPLKILHWTNHPGIESTSKIKKSIESLQKKGYLIEFRFLKGVSQSSIMEEVPDADLTIGKMKMGYYANSQIEAMACGVPTITWVRPEFMTDELMNSGFIFSHPDELEETLKYYLDNPGKLEEKRIIARESILKLHDNISLANKYKDIYNSLYSR